MNTPNNPRNPNSNFSVFWKAIATIATCVMLIVSMVVTGVFLAPNMGDEALGAVVVVMAGAIVMNGFIWNWGSTGQRRMNRMARESAESELYDFASHAREKPKRDRLNVSLSHLSDDELLDLREKLRNGEMDERELAEILQQQR